MRVNIYTAVSCLAVVPRLFLYGRGEKGEGMKGLVNNSTPTWIHGISIIDSCEATNTYKFIVPHLNAQPHVHTTHSHEISFTTHTYLTFAFSLINTDGRNAAVDPRWGRVIASSQATPRFYLTAVEKNREIKSGSGLGTRLVELFTRPFPPRPYRKGLGTSHCHISCCFFLWQYATRRIKNVR